MNIKQKTVDGVCNAMRCTDETTGEHEGHFFCARHLIEAQKSTLVPDTDEAKALAKAAKEFADETRCLDALLIDSQNTLDLVNCVLVEVKTRWKDLEVKRKSITQPLMQAKNAADALFKPALTALAEAEKTLKTKIDVYFTAQNEAKIEALVSGDIENAMTIVPPTLTQGVSARPVLDYILRDINLVPREYLCLDHSAVRLAMAADKNIQIPGIEFFEKQQVSVRT